MKTCGRLKRDARARTCPLQGAGPFGKVTPDLHPAQDRNTQQPRGFGFVTFMSAEVAEDVASRKQVIVDGRSVEVKRAVPRGEEEVVRKKSSPVSPSPTGSLSPQHSAASPIKLPPSVHTANKIFVGGIAWSTADDEFHRCALAGPAPATLSSRVRPRAPPGPSTARSPRQRRSSSAPSRAGSSSGTGPWPPRTL